MHTALRIAFTAGIALTLGGCAAPTMWETNLERGPEGASAAMLKSPSSSQIAMVKVRKAPWERIQSVLFDIERDVAASDAPVEEWTPDQLRAMEAKLLKGLQVTAAPERVQVLGRSTFSTTDALPQEDSLQALGAKLGATHVVWSSQVVGKVDKIVSSPASSNTYGTRYRRNSDGSRDPDSYQESTTTWIPVRVTADQVGAIAYFLRIEE
jgi:hypothetical protein